MTFNPDADKWPARVFPNYNGLVTVSNQINDICGDVINKYHLDYSSWHSLARPTSFRPGINDFISFCLFAHTEALENKSLEEVYLLYKLSKED